MQLARTRPGRLAAWLIMGGLLAACATPPPPTAITLPTFPGLAIECRTHPHLDAAACEAWATRALAHIDVPAGARVVILESLTGRGGPRCRADILDAEGRRLGIRPLGCWPRPRGSASATSAAPAIGSVAAAG